MLSDSIHAFAKLDILFQDQKVGIARIVRSSFWTFQHQHCFLWRVSCEKPDSIQIAGESVARLDLRLTSLGTWPRSDLVRLEQIDSASCVDCAQ